MEALFCFVFRLLDVFWVMRKTRVANQAIAGNLQRMDNDMPKNAKIK
jgi:hypothetical protein